MSTHRFKPGDPVILTRYGQQNASLQAAVVEILPNRMVIVRGEKCGTVMVGNWWLEPAKAGVAK